MRVLALEPYFGGSHEAFLSGWAARSRHTWRVLGLSPTKWKWRMRHAPWTLSQRVLKLMEQGEGWDAVFCSDMLDLAAFMGLAPRSVGDVPSVVYFHENQLTYPVRAEDERDYHFVFSNIMAACRADAVWFNSCYHRETFLSALPGFLKRMPDYRPLEVVELIREKSEVQHPAVAMGPGRGGRRPGPMRVLWAARWEYDKGAEDFFEALDRVREQGIEFRLSVLGGRPSRYADAAFEQAYPRFRDCIDRWGFASSRQAYAEALEEADVVVSTAKHEFFGMAVVEAVAHGAYPLVPDRLAYPEVLGDRDGAGKGFFYLEGARGLAEALVQTSARLEAGRLWEGDPQRGRRRAERYTWERSVPAWDRALQALRKSTKLSRPAAGTGYFE